MKKKEGATDETEKKGHPPLHGVSKPAAEIKNKGKTSRHEHVMLWGVTITGP